jgi:hypothetical protein
MTGGIVTRGPGGSLDRTGTSLGRASTSLGGGAGARRIRFRAQDYAPPGLEGLSRGLAVIFWTTLLVTSLMVAGLVVVTTSSQLVADFCSEACDRGYELDPLLRSAMLYSEPVLIGLALLAWMLGRRPPRQAASALFAALLTVQFGLAAWAAYAIYSLTTR